MKIFGFICLPVLLALSTGCKAPTDAGPILEAQGKQIPATAEEAKIIGEGGRLPAATEPVTPAPPDAPVKPSEPAGRN